MREKLSYLSFLFVFIFQYSIALFSKLQIFSGKIRVWFGESKIRENPTKGLFLLYWVLIFVSVIYILILIYIYMYVYSVAYVTHLFV